MSSHRAYDEYRNTPLWRALAGIINMLDLVKYRLAEIELEANALKAYVAGTS